MSQRRWPGYAAAPVREECAVRRRDGAANTRPGLRAWLALAREPAVVRRALKFGLVVGAILITINHSDAILAGDVDGRRLLKMGLTVLVPYTVSTLSSVGAALAFREELARRKPPR
jgi:hypothetical protein